MTTRTYARATAALKVIRHFLSDARQLIRLYIDTSDTYTPPPRGWTCFHCGETFRTREAATVHFGRSPSEPAGCTIDVEDYRNMRYELHAARVKLIRAGLMEQWEQT